MKKSIYIILLLLSTLSFSQKIPKTTPQYSEDSAITVIYSDSLNFSSTEHKPVAYYINDLLIGDKNIINTIDPKNIDSVRVEKEKFFIDGTEYFGKILIKLDPKYVTNFLTLKEITDRYLKLNNNPIIIQIDDTIIGEDYDKYLINENFILMITVNKIKTSGKNIEINLINILTKKAGNIEMKNKIIIK